MVKRFKVSLYAAGLAVLGLLSVGCSFGSFGGWFPFNDKVDSIPRILTAILREDLFS